MRHMRASSMLRVGTWGRPQRVEGRGHRQGLGWAAQPVRQIISCAGGTAAASATPLHNPSFGLMMRSSPRALHVSVVRRHGQGEGGGGSKCEHRSTSAGAVPWTFTPHDADKAAAPASQQARRPPATGGTTSASVEAASGGAAASDVYRHTGPAPAKDGQRGITSLEYCAAQTKRLDYEHYLCSMYLPKEARSPFHVLRAFNIETAIIKDVAKQVPLALMRLQFWRDLVDRSFKGNPPEHPVAIQIANMVPRYKWSRTWFTRILNKRTEDIEGRPIPTLAALENFAEDTSSSLLYLTLESLRVRNMDADHAASHIGKAVGMSLLLRGTPYHFTHRQTYLPMDLMAKHGVSEESLYRGDMERAQNLPEVVYEVATAAHLHLKHARDLRTTVPKEAYPALYSAFIAEEYLKKLEKAKFNIFDPSLLPGPQNSLGLQAKLLYNYYLSHKY